MKSRINIGQRAYFSRNRILYANIHLSILGYCSERYIQTPISWIDKPNAESTTRNNGGDIFDTPDEPSHSLELQHMSLEPVRFKIFFANKSVRFDPLQRGCSC